MALKNVQHIMSSALQEGFQLSECCSGKRTRRVYLVNVCERCSHSVSRAHEQGMIWSSLDENPTIGDIAADCLCGRALTGTRKAINKQDLRVRDGRLHSGFPSASAHGSVSPPCCTPGARRSPYRTGPRPVTVTLTQKRRTSVKVNLRWPRS